jgi:hypothetical protein
VVLIELDISSSFTAARARNAGFARISNLAPEIAYVQFVDADCEVREGWIKHAIAFLDSHSKVGAVCGRLRERYPQKSIYNWLCDREWDVPGGEVPACGGIAMMRIAALKGVGGFREDLIAGEEPELCIRLRRKGWQIWRLETEMAIHDAAMTRFIQWWRRMKRSGYAFAQGAYLHGSPPERHWVWESRRAWLWGIWLPLACLATGLIFGGWGWGAWLIYPAQMLRQIMRNKGPISERILMAQFQVLSRFAEAWGQINFMRDRLIGRQPQLIEYK